MLLRSIYLQNFRQFRAESIEFGQGEGNQVTVIHGQNGSGKTTLKNAFTWALYGSVSFSLRPDKLASQGAFAEIDPGETASVEVRLEFDHEDATYELVRRADYQRQNETDFEGELVDESVELRYETADGDRGSRGNPRQAIEQILPERLSNLFFFDGEYITQLSDSKSQNQVRSAIRRIMGLTIIERAINHLDDVEKRFEAELQEHADLELSALLDDRSELREELEDTEAALEAAKNSRDELQREVSEIEEALEGIEDAADLQREREQLQKQLEKTKERIRETNEELEDELSKKANLVFAMPALEATAQELDQLRTDGKLPAEISNEFIENLVDRGECICGRPLEPDTDPHDAVLEHKSAVDGDGVDQAAIQILSTLRGVQADYDQYFDRMDTLLGQRADLRDRRTDLEERLDDISGELEGLDLDAETGETPAELEEARTTKLAEREATSEKIGKLEAEIEKIDDSIQSLTEQIEAARQEQGEAELARKRMQAAAEVRKQLETSFENLQKRVVNWSNDLVKETFSEIASKDYRAEITDEFELRIKDRLEGEYLEVEKSRGERQLASLTFIGSLVQIARERYESDADTEYFTGGIYPILMDSPYGALDDEHRRQVSNVIPRMAPQVVTLVTDSQWRGPVANELSETAGYQYRLEFDPGEGTDSYPRTRVVTEAAPEESA
jgi:DNA sulfur modification protein DndD